MDEKLREAWQAFFEGKPALAAKLEGELTADSFSRLNLQAYLAVEDQDYSRAAAILQAYLSKAQTEEDQENEHVAYHQLAYVARAAGDLSSAWDWIETESAFLARHFPEDHYRQSVNLYERGYLQLKLGLLGQAEKWMEQALAYALETDDLINQACVYRGLGEIDLAKGLKKQAKTHLEKAAALFRLAEDQVGAAEVEALLQEC